VHAVLAVDAHDLLQPLLGAEAHQLQPAAGHEAGHVAQELDVHHHLAGFAAQQLLHLDDLLDVPARNEAALQVGEVRIDLQCVQRRVVPGEFHQRAIALLHLGRRLAVADGAAVCLHQLQHRGLA